jgi:hypothetical protein
MKRNSDIASLFQKRAAKKAAAASSPSPAAQEKETIVEKIMDPISPPIPSVPLDNVSPPPQSAPPVYDINRLPQDPGERQAIQSYDVNDQDAIRRAYILKGPLQPYAHDFPKRKIGNRDRQFNFVWFANHHWLEYSIKKDVVFCFVCYLFRDNKCKGKGADTFITDGWRNWNIGNKALPKHVGSSAHKAAQERYNGFVNPTAAIDYHIEKWSDEDLRLYKIRLTYSLKCLKFLLHQGLAFRGHDESEESSNRGNFLELLKFLAANSEEVNKYVLKNAPGNCTLTCPDIQKQIIQCCAIETRKKIIVKASFDAQKIRRLAEFYPNDIISNANLQKLELQLDNYIDDIRQDDSFKSLGNLVDLSVKLVETKRHIVYDLVYMLLKLVLLLPVATASVERVFSAMSLVKSKLRNKMGDSLLDDCLVTFIERDIFFKIDEDDIIKNFMAIRRRRPNKKDKK